MSGIASAKINALMSIGNVTSQRVGRKRVLRKKKYARNRAIDQVLRKKVRKHDIVHALDQGKKQVLRSYFSIYIFFLFDKFPPLYFKTDSPDKQTD